MDQLHAFDKIGVLDKRISLECDSATISKIISPRKSHLLQQKKGGRKDERERERVSPSSHDLRFSFFLPSFLPCVLETQPEKTRVRTSSSVRDGKQPERA